MNASSATQHLASNATAAPGLQPTPMPNHWLQGLPATTISVPSDSIVKKALEELPKPTLSSEVWCLAVCLDQHFLDCHINVTLLYNMEEINKDTEEELPCFQRGGYWALTGMFWNEYPPRLLMGNSYKLLTHDKDLHFPVGSTGQGESGYMATRALLPHSSTVAFTGAT